MGLLEVKRAQMSKVIKMIRKVWSEEGCLERIRKLKEEKGDEKAFFERLEVWLSANLHIDDDWAMACYETMLDCWDKYHEPVDIFAAAEPVDIFAERNIFGEVA